MDIRSIRYFVEVARHRSFTRASELLHITQPTISKMVKNLEEELGVTLLDRTSRHVQLTDAGEIVYARAQQIVTSMEEVATELGDLMHLHRGTVRIGIPPMVGAAFFPAVLSGFHARYPQIALRLHEDGSKKVEQRLEEGVLDLGIMVLPVDEAVLESVPFAHEDLRLVVHPNHPLAGRSQAAVRELRAEAFILFREDFSLHDRIRRACQEAGFEPLVICESSQWDFIGASVAANLGIALLPETICKRLDPAQVRIVKLVEPFIPWHLAIIWRKDRYMSFAARAWIEFARAHLQSTGPMGAGG